VKDCRFLLRATSFAKSISFRPTRQDREEISRGISANEAFTDIARRINRSARLGYALETTYDNIIKRLERKYFLIFEVLKK